MERDGGREVSTIPSPAAVVTAFYFLQIRFWIFPLFRLFKVGALNGYLQWCFIKWELDKWDQCDEIRVALSFELVKVDTIGQLLWIGWLSGRFRHQRSADGVQSSANFNYFINCIEKTKIKKKEAENCPFVKKSWHNFDVHSLHLTNSSQANFIRAD